MDLDALRDFQLVVAHGGFGKASRATGRSKATLSRRVADLEEALGARLLERGSQRLLLTDAGQLLLRRTEGPLHEVADAVAAVRDGIATPHGQLRVATPILFAQVALGRLVARFRDRYPAVVIEAVATDRAVHLVNDGFDVAVRTNPRRERELTGQCFARDALVLAAPPWIPIPSGPAGARYPLPAVVTPSFRDGQVWSLRTGDIVVEPQPVVRLSSLLAVRDAVVEGAGVGILPRSIIGPQLAQGALISRELDRDEVELWALHSAGRLQSPKVRAFVSFLADQYPDGRFVVGS